MGWAARVLHAVILDQHTQDIALTSLVDASCYTQYVWRSLLVRSRTRGCLKAGVIYDELDARKMLTRLNLYRIV